MPHLDHCLNAEGARPLPQSTIPLNIDRDITGLINCKAIIVVVKVKYEDSFSMSSRGRA